VEEAIPEGVDLQILDAVGGITCAGQHVMPLQDLVQHDAVEKAAQPEPKENTGRYWESLLAD
jgi:hypothetical protein